MRIGIGYDVHAFREGRRLILGGVEIKYWLGLEGHSDADVLVHAVMDAMLGACGLGDIGVNFPDSDIQYKDISSLLLLGMVRKKMEAAGYGIVNIDSVIIAEEPKLGKYLDSMCRNIAKVLKIDSNRVNVKATTTEGLGFCGRKEGIAAQCTVLLE
ncbi:MAG: 2-C-methyl-D-erythritol 2,4-cyclodiphosphate synthase [Actinobacteria bacterium]|nr:2-C-methyl-D-erythritol 2,4-cyclodiphosphate synthase [Actinomycetota bacterium]